MDYRTTTVYRNAAGRGHALDMRTSARTPRVSTSPSRHRQVHGHAGSDRPVRHILRPQPVSVPVTQPVVSQSTPAQAAPKYPLPVYQAPERIPLTVGRKSFVRGLRRVAVGTLAVVFVLSGFLAWRGYAAANKVLDGSTTVAALASAKVSPSALGSEGDGRVNIALLGIGGAGHSGGDLTDTIIIMSVDPVNHTAAMVSVPRDLWIKMPNDYYGAHQKINAAYSAGKYGFLKKNGTKNSDKAAIAAGFKTFDAAISQVMGVRVDYHVLVDFKAFKQAVDSVGGVNVDVKTALVDPSMAWENGNSSVLAAAGAQHMDGEQALLYARSRHTSSDFARSERQRQLIMALKDKVLSFGTFSDPTKLESLVDALGDNIYTDISTTAAVRLYGISKKITDKDMTSLDLASAENRLVTTDRVGTISVVRPTRGYDAYSDIQAYIRPHMRDGYLTKENSAVAVIAPTQPILDDAQQTLTKLGYFMLNGVIRTESQPSDAASGVTLIDLSGGTAPYTKHYLEKRYQVHAKTVVPDGVNVPDGAKFVILLAK